jgi:hypothetical protein
VGVGGALYVGGQINLQNTSDSTSTNTGALVVAGGIGIAGNVSIGNRIAIATGQAANFAIDISGDIAPKQYVESMSFVTVSSNTITIAYGSGLIYDVSGTVSAPITGVTITNIPQINNKVYTLTFIIHTTNSANYITASTLTINGSYTPSVASSISGLSTPTNYIVQTFTIFYYNNSFTTLKAITSAFVV